VELPGRIEEEDLSSPDLLPPAPSLTVTGWLCLAAVLTAAIARSDELATPICRPTKISRPPVIDGRLDEPEWSQALSISDFVQRAPQEGHEPTERTEVLLMYTSSDLFIGVRAFDSVSKDIIATVMRRDNFDVSQDDQFVVAIDSYNDRRNGYWSSTNPLGVRVDAQFWEEGEVWEGDWNGVWKVRSRSVREIRVGPEGKRKFE